MFTLQASPTRLAEGGTHQGEARGGRQGQIHRILVIRPRYVGDVLLTVPTLRRLRESFPHAQVTFVASPGVRDLIEHCPYVDDVLILENRGEHKGLAGRLKFIRQLRQRRFDLAVVLQRSFLSALCTWLAGIPLRIGFSTDWRGPLLTHKVAYDKAAYEAQCFLSVIETLGIEGGNLALEAWVPDEDRAYVDRWFDEQGIGREERILFVNPGGCTPRRIDEAKLAQVTDAVIESYGPRAIVIWGPGERFRGEAVVRAMNNPALIAPQTSILQLAALFERGNLLVTPNSSPLHLAAAVDLPTVALFGPLRPEKWNPQGGRNAFVKREISCHPCSSKNCPNNDACMQMVAVDDVLAAVARTGVFRRRSSGAACRSTIEDRSPSKAA